MNWRFIPPAGWKWDIFTVVCAKILFMKVEIEKKIMKVEIVKVFYEG